MPYTFDFDANQTELCRLKNDRLIFLGEIENWKGSQTSIGLEKLKQQLYLCEFKIAENEKEYERAVKKRISGMVSRHVIMISICSSQQSARIYLVIYHNQDQTINEHTLLWAIHVGSNHDEAPNVAKCLYQTNDDKSVGSESSTISCFSLVCCILIAHTTDKASAVRCIEKVEERNDQEHTPTSSKAFVRDAVDMLSQEKSILAKHQLNWDMIEARTVRYSYLQSDDFSQTYPAQDLHYANGLIATYDLINEQDITLRLTKYHQNGLVGFVARKTKCLRTSVYKALQG